MKLLAKLFCKLESTRYVAVRCFCDDRKSAFTSFIEKCLRDVLFIVRVGSGIIKADFMHIKRTTFPTKMKTGILLEELK